MRDKLRVAKAMAADTDNPQAERFAGNVAALEKVQRNGLKPQTLM